MSITPKTKLCLSMVAGGGACAIGTPVMMNYLQKSSHEISDNSLTQTQEQNDLTQVNLDTEPQKPSLENHLQKPNEQLKSKTQQSTLSSDGIEKIHAAGQESEVINRENEKNFEELWQKIAQGYQQKQAKNSDYGDHQLSWEQELKNILLQEGNPKDTWEIKEEQYKDCTRVSGNKNDYCGYLALNRGNYEYKLKFDRYDWSHSKKWDVYIVRKSSDGTKYYSKDGTWKASPTASITSFKGEQDAQNNWWIKLDHPSITI